MNLSLGLIIYWDSRGTRFRSPSVGLPLVISPSLEDLIEHLRLGTLAKAITDLRNKAARGVVA